MADLYMAYDGEFHLVSGGGTVAGGFSDFLEGTVTDIEDEDATSLRMYGCAYYETLVTVSLPNVTTVGESAFLACHNLTTVDMPSVTSWGPGAFYECSSLTSDAFISSLPVVPDSMFSWTGLTSVSRTETTEVGYSTYNGTPITEAVLPNLETAKDGAFSSCPNLVEIDFPNLVTAEAVGGLFAGCASLETVSIPAVTLLGWGTFSDCPSLTSVDVSSLTSMNGTTFSGCTALTEIELPALLSMNYGEFYGSGVVTLSLPAMETFAETSALYGATALTTLDLGAVTVIDGGQPMSGAENLTTLIVRTSGCVVTSPYSNWLGGTGISSAVGDIYVPDADVAAYQAAYGWAYYASRIKGLSLLP